MRKLKRLNGSWIDENIPVEEDREFKGHLMKDLDMGDSFEFNDLQGKRKKTTILNKVIREDGFIIVEHETREV